MATKASKAKKKMAVANKSVPLVLERKSEREELAKDMHTMQEIEIGRAHV